jgi:outer membrane protein assembly factor BamB
MRAKPIRSPALSAVTGLVLVLAAGSTVGIGYAQQIFFPPNMPRGGNRIILRGGGIVAGQAGNNAKADGNDVSGENVFLWADRSVLQRLNSAKELLRQGRFGEAARYLGGIVEAPEDYFVPPAAGDEAYRSLKGEANQLIGKMPAAGRESYELQYGPRAKRMLEEAVAKGDAGGLAEISRRFFHTEAGYQATLLLGLDNLDRGSPLSAALTLQRLRQVGPEADRFEPTLSLAEAIGWMQAGLRDQASATLVKLKQSRGESTVTLRGRSVRLFAAGADPLAWVTETIGPQQPAEALDSENWLLYRGNAARNAGSKSSTPLLNTRWHIPVTDDPLVENDIQGFRQMYRDRGVSEAPSLHPLVVNDVVLMRTVRNLLAVDFVTGKRLWEVPAEDHLETPVDSSANEIMFDQAPQLSTGLQQRIWDDLAYGTLSSDGKCVFSIEDLGLATGGFSGRAVIGLNGRRQRDPNEPRSFNRLTAHEIKTGKLKWHLGGPADHHALRQPDTFFLGPPLPLAGRLYVLAEVNEEIRLLALDAERGDVLWTQQLAVVEQDITHDMSRRLSGVSPSYADGILVCPTATGAVVAVELATRSLLWGYRYERRREAGSMNVAMIRMSMMRGEEPNDNWSDSSVTLVGGKVLFGAADSDQLHCLNLLDGKLLWRQPCKDTLYLACVQQGNAVLVGRHEVSAIQLSDSMPGWNGKKVPLPDGSVPSGQGFLSGSTYYLPLSSAEVVAIDVAEGKMGHSAKSHSGTVPGNLVAYRGYVISHSVDGVDNYYQLAALRKMVDQRLTAKPNDAEALALRGEVLLDEDRRDDAIACLRQSYRLAPEIRTRELLRDALLGGLQAAFDQHHADAAEIERLLDDPQQEVTYLRLMAEGLQRSGKWGPALERYAKMIDLDQDHARLESVSPAVSIRRDAWIRSQLTALRQAMPADQLPQIDNFVRARWQKAQADSSIDAVSGFLRYFGGQPGSQEARKVLLAGLMQRQRLLEAELLLRQDLQTIDPPQAAAATAAWAKLLHGAKRYRDAAEVYKQLGQQYGNVVCAERGKTGRQIIQALADDDPVQTALAVPAEWPVGKVDLHRVKEQHSSMASYGKFALRYLGDPGPFFADIQLYYDQNRSFLMARNELGGIVWQVSLADQSRQRNFGFNQAGACVRTNGHLLVLAMDRKIFALDTLTDGTLGPRILWTQDLDERSGAAGKSLRAHFPAAMRWGMINVFNGGMGVNNGNNVALGPVTDHVVCLQRGREVMAVNPADGETLWVRNDLPQGSMLLGDDQYLFVLGPGHAEATVVNTSDGSTAGQRKLPPVDQWVTVAGREVLVWKAGAQCQLERIDLWDSHTVWEKKGFDSAARWFAIGNEAVAVLEPSGLLAILSTDKGLPLVQTKIDPVTQLQDICVHACQRGYYLIVNRQPSEALQTTPMQQMPGTLFRPVYQGLVYAFDRHGKTLWPHPVKVTSQHFWQDQPADLPVLIFGCQTYLRKNNAGQFVSAVLCIDKRTGRVVANEAMPNSTGVFEAVGEPEKSQVEIRLTQNALRLKFTDQPLPAEEKPAAETDSADGQSGTSILEALMKSAAEGLRAATQPPPAKPAGGTAPVNPPNARPVQPLVPPPAQTTPEKKTNEPAAPATPSSPQNDPFK